jgi:uncharacterized BrkB/YihY/UPF0761 family membrane protein
VFGQAARLAFYYFLGIFPALLLLLVFLNTLSSAGSELRNTLLDYIQEIVPAGASALLAKTLAELNLRATVAAGALWAVPSAAWAIFNQSCPNYAFRGRGKPYGRGRNRRSLHFAALRSG